MRKRIAISGACILAFCLWMSLARRPIDTAGTVNGSTSSVLYQRDFARLSRPTESKPSDGNHNPAANIPPPGVPSGIAMTTNGFFEQILPEWQAPITFYGVVVDESNNRLQGASVQFSWDETPMEDGGRTAATESDSKGLFELQDAHGPSLDVRISKQGYYTPKNANQGFVYAISGHFSPDPLNPVVFQLKKKSVADKLVEVKQNLHVPRDGTPVGIDLTTGKIWADGTGDFVVQCWTQNEVSKSGKKYNWRCVVSVPGGGMATTNEEFAFLAPDNGYMPSIEVAMPADRPDWKIDADLKFYYRLADGRYGRMTFSMIAGGQHFCMIDSLLNPSGSCNLEFDPNNPIPGGQ